MRKIKRTKRTVGRRREGNNNKGNKVKLSERRRREGKQKRMTNVGTR